MKTMPTARDGAATERASYPLWAQDTIRFSDLDPQGHVNNAVYAIYFLTGRVAYLRSQRLALLAPDETFVTARLEIDFLSELQWPGTIEIGTRILSAGGSSFRMGEGIFQGSRCIATAEVVTVLLDRATRKPRPLTPRIEAWLCDPAAAQP